MVTSRAWLLNFDAEAELEDPSAHTPARSVLLRAVGLIEKVRDLLGPGDVVLPPLLPSPDVRGLLGRAWCPTPQARAELAKAGARVPEAPPYAVLRRVNHRRFCADLGQMLDGARYVENQDELRETLAVRAGEWVLKRPFGFAGRGRMRVRGGRTGRVEPSEERWIEASLDTGEGLQVEPWVDRDADFALHGYISRVAVVTLGAPTKQRCDEYGAWIESRRADAFLLPAPERDALFAATEEAAAALSQAGYFGPFGVDAYRYRDRGGALRFNARGEINARYSMGWATGMGPVRPDLEPDVAED